MKAINLDLDILKLSCLAASNILSSDLFKKKFLQVNRDVNDTDLTKCIMDGFLLDVMRISSSSNGYIIRAKHADDRTVYINSLFLTNGIEYAENDFFKIMELSNVLTVTLVLEASHILNFHLVLSRNQSVEQHHTPELIVKGLQSDDFGFIMEHLLFGGHLHFGEWKDESDVYPDIINECSVHYLLFRRTVMGEEENVIIKHNTNFFRPITTKEDLQFQWRLDFDSDADDESVYAQQRKRNDLKPVRSNKVEEKVKRSVYIN